MGSVLDLQLLSTCGGMADGHVAQQRHDGGMCNNFLLLGGGLKFQVLIVSHDPPTTKHLFVVKWPKEEWCLRRCG